MKLSVILTFRNWFGKNKMRAEEQDDIWMFFRQIVRLASFPLPAHRQAIGCLGSHPRTRLCPQWAESIPPLGILWTGGWQCTQCGWEPKGRKRPSQLEASLVHSRWGWQSCVMQAGLYILCLTHQGAFQSWALLVRDLMIQQHTWVQVLNMGTKRGCSSVCVCVGGCVSIQR